MEIDKSKFSKETQDLIDLLLSPEWPEAVPDFLICADTEEDKLGRAQGILDYAEFKLDGKKFCDFGCGEGHVATLASDYASFTVGYDILEHENFTKIQKERLLLTSSSNELLANAPYDFIMVYDVIDHAENPEALLSQLKAISHKDTKIFIRFHSWMSRHASHLYRQINKAWLHLVFTQKEIELLGLNPTFVYKYFTPLHQQDKWIKSMNGIVEKSEITKSFVEPFFKQEKIFKRLPNINNRFPDWQMSQSFNDYWVKF